MTEKPRPRLALTAVCATVLVAALAVAQGLTRRPSGQQEVVRLVEVARADPTAVQFHTTPPTQTTSEGRLLSAGFPGALGTWTALRTWTRAGVEDTTTLPIVRGQERDRRFVTFEGSALLLAKVVPVIAGQALAVEMTSRWRGAAAQGSESRDGLLGILPMRTHPDLYQELTGRTLQDLWERERCVGHGQPLTLGPAAPDAGWQVDTAAFRAPFDARSLLLVYSAGDGDAAQDLDQLHVRPVTARELTGFGELPATVRTLVPDRTDDTSLASFGIQPFDPRFPWLATVDGLAERRDALVLPPPASFSLEVSVPGGDVVLEFGVARLWEQRPGWNRNPIDLSLQIETADGVEVLHEERLKREDPTGFQDRSVDLRRWAGRTVRLTFQTDTVRSLDQVAIGAPLIRRRAPGPRRPNVILVSIDTLRADHLGVAGYPRPTTPNLDELARRNLWFANARSTCSYTLPSHGSMLTGQLPSLHGAISQAAGENRVSSRNSDLLAVRLRDAGYLTAAFTGGSYLDPGFGFGEGFDRYSTMDALLADDDPTWDLRPVRNDPEFNRRHREGRRMEQILEWIREHRDSEFFLFLHTYVVHNYLPGQDACARFHDGPRSDSDRFMAWKGDKRRDHATIPRAELTAGIDLYDATLSEADLAIGQLVEALKAQQLWYDTVLVVTSDHGEEFLDHGRLGHGRTLYDEQLRVPLILHLPDAPPPRTIHDPVSILDVTPTLLDVVGIELLAPSHGLSLLRYRDGTPDDEEPRPLLAELHIKGSEVSDEVRWRSLVHGPLKLVEDLSDSETHPEPTRSLYDVVRDPRETIDLSASQQDAMRLLVGQAEAVQSQAARLRATLQDLQSGDATLDSLPQDVLEQLRQNGYVDHAPDPLRRR